MSRGKWRRCPATGISLARLEKVSEEYLTPDGHFDPRRLPDCDLFDVRSVAAACGFRNWRYFQTRVLVHPECPIHVHRLRLADDETGQFVAEIVATHQNSAVDGGAMWRETQVAAARERAMFTTSAVASDSLLNVSSGS